MVSMAEMRDRDQKKSAFVSKHIFWVMRFPFCSPDVNNPKSSIKHR